MKQMTQSKFLSATILMMTVATGSGCASTSDTSASGSDDPSHSDSQGLCTDGIVTVALPDEAAEAGGAIASRVVGMEGVSCEDLEQPLAAINWYVEPTDPDDAASLAQYNQGIVPLSLEAGTKTLFAAGGPTTTTLPLGPEPPLQGGDFLALLVYESAEGFAGMVTSEEYGEIAPLKLDVKFESYSFVFQDCVLGCDSSSSLPLPSIAPPAVIIHLAVDDDPYALSLADRNRLRSALIAAEASFAEDGYSVDYAGVSVAYPDAPREDGTNAFEYGVNGIDATLIVTPDRGSAIGDAIQTDAFVTLQGEATATVVAQIGG